MSQTVIPFETLKLVLSLLIFLPLCFYFSLCIVCVLLSLYCMCIVLYPLYCKYIVNILVSEIMPYLFLLPPP